jgi:hypothetical protein
VFCSVAVIHYLSPRLALCFRVPLQRVDFLCADWSLSVSSGRYIPFVGRYLDLAKRRCQSVLWVIGSCVHCQYLLYDAGMILRSHWRRVRFVWSYCMRIYTAPRVMGGRNLFLDVFWSLLYFRTEYITRLLTRAVNSRNGIATYSYHSVLSSKTGHRE